MPTPATSKIPPPKSEDEFEDIVADALKIRFNNPSLVRLGRRGQNQHGIDGLDPTATADSAIVWQATVQVGRLLEKIDRDLERLDADSALRPRTFVFAIARGRDATVQAELIKRSSERTAAGKCPVLPLFWDDILGDLFSDENLARKHFPKMYAPQSLQPQIEEDDLLLLSALEERDQGDSQNWVSSFEVAVRTGLAPRALDDAVEIQTEAGHVEGHPFGEDEKAASSFAYRRMRITAKGRRLLRSVPHSASLPGPILPPAVNVQVDYPDKNIELLLREQSAGFRVAWEYETLLIDRAESFEPVIAEVGLRPARLQVQLGEGTLLLVRKPLRDVEKPEVEDLVKKQFPGAAYVEHGDGKWVAKRIEPGPAVQGGPPAYVSTKILGEGTTLVELLSNLRILVPAPTIPVL